MEDIKTDYVEIGDLEYNVGPVGSSESVGGVPCAALFVLIEIFVAT